MSFAQEAERQKNEDALGRIAGLLERSGIDVEDVGKVKTVRLNEYQALIKNDEGKAEVHDLQAASIVLSPKWEDGPDWPVVQQAAPIVVRPRKPVAAPLVRKWKTAVALPDPQIGYRLIDGQFDPFHDVSAMDVALQVLELLAEDGGVDKCVNLGDFLDLPQQSRFIQEAAFAGTMQKAVDFGHEFLARQRAAVGPDAELVVLEGNHDKRMQNYITTNAVAAFGLKKANAPESWPVMSLPFLLRMDELNVVYIDAWPAGEYWINNTLRCIHGNKVRSNNSTANATVKDNPNISTLFGHIHRIEVHYKTIHERTGPLRSVAVSPGCLARIDGAVPSVNGSTGIDGHPAVHWEDWQQGFAVVRYTDSQFFVTPHQILDGTTLFAGQEIKARKAPFSTC